MFKFPSHETSKTITVSIEGDEVQVPTGTTVAAAVLTTSIGHTRTTAVSDSPRAPMCMMGVCYECLMVIDGRANRRACQETVAEGMRIERQQGTGPS